MSQAEQTGASGGIPADGGISCFIICRNEADNIGRAIASVAALDEIVVVDAHSEDGTADIARAAGARVIAREWEGYSRQKQFALDQCQSRYALNLDADEEASPALIAELRTAATAGVCGLKIPRREYRFGRWESPAVRKNALVRFFRRDLARYGDHLVHEQVFVDGNLGRARAAIFHRGEKTIAAKAEKILAYASLRARERSEKGKKGSRLKMVFAFPFAFFRSYILRRAALDGWRGFVNAMLNAFYAFLKEAKLLETSEKPRSDRMPPE